MTKQELFPLQFFFVFNYLILPLIFDVSNKISLRVCYLRSSPFIMGLVPMRTPSYTKQAATNG